MTGFSETLAAFFPQRLRQRIAAAYADGAEEIHLRKNKPLHVVYDGKDELFDDILVTDDEIRECLESFCSHSVYSCEDEMRQGFITLPSCGIRAGICGDVLTDGDAVRRFRAVTGFCIRIPHEHVGCSRELCKAISGLDGGSVLIASPPAGGKTTLLRDMARELSDEYAKKVCIVDERSEIAGCALYSETFDVGKRTDVLDGCPKAQGLLMAVRTLSPHVIITDEVGSASELESIRRVLCSGVSVAVSVHAESEDGMSEVCRDIMKLMRYTVLLRRSGRKRIMLFHDRQTGEKRVIGN